MKCRFCVLLAVCLCSASMDRYNLNDTAFGEGAVCLDGSTGIYYHKAGSKANSTKWAFHLLGGGMCITEEECLFRTTMYLGSSKDYPPTIDFDGPLSEDQDFNHDFYDWNHVFMPYCDGAFFAGDAELPAVVNGTKIYFRGHRILVATFKELLATKGLDKATDVLIVGDSAGAMATYYHADEIKSMLPEKVRFKAAPFSGIFLDRRNAEGKDFFKGLFKQVYQMQNCTHTLNAECQKYFGEEEGYNCFFAHISMEFTETPLFAINSAYDLVAMLCIVLGEPLIGPSTSGVGNCSAIPGWEDCDNHLKCSPEQYSKLEEYAEAWRNIVYNSPKLTSRGNGLYEYSCFTHAEEPYNPQWKTYSVQGVILRDAVRDWFFSDNDPASKHFYQDCNNTNTTDCNPTCADPLSGSSSSISPKSISSSHTSSSSGSFVYPVMSIIVASFFAALFSFF